MKTAKEVQNEAISFLNEAMDKIKENFIEIVRAAGGVVKMIPDAKHQVVEAVTVDGDNGFPVYIYAVKYDEDEKTLKFVTDNAVSNFEFDTDETEDEFNFSSITEFDEGDEQETLNKIIDSGQYDETLDELKELIEETPTMIVLTNSIGFFLN